MKSCDTGDMMTDTAAPSYIGFRFPQEIISHAVWLYFRFNLVQPFGDPYRVRRQAADPYRST